MKAHLRFAVIGVGRFGSAIAKKLFDKGAEVMAIDSDKYKINEIKDHVTYSVVLDSTDKNAILSQNIQEMDAVVVSIGEDFQAIVLTSFILQELNVKRIIVRAQSATQRKILSKIGITEILSPEDEVSNNVAESLINPKVKFSIELPDSYKILEVNAPRGVIGRSLKDIQLREKYDLNLVTLLRKNMGSHHIIGIPKVETIIEENDMLIVFGRVLNIDKFLQIND